MPLELVARILEREGGLIEAQDDGTALAVLPRSLQAALELPEAAVLSEHGGENTVPCGYGTEVFRVLTQGFLGRARTAVVQARVTLPSRRTPGEYAGLNVALRTAAAASSSGWILAAHFLMDALADDRRQGRLEAAVSLAGGAPVPPPPLEGVRLEPTGDRPDADTLRRAEASLVRGAVREAVTALAPFRESIARRSRRDVQRVDRYFQEMDEDLARRARGREKGTGLARKRQLLPAERGRRLENLRENGTIRVRLSPIAYLLVQSPVACADLTVLRRRERREVRVYWHPLLRRWLPLRCEGCGDGTYAIGACDDAVHLLCAACLDAGGRTCPVCEKGGAEPERRVEVAGRTEEILVPGYAPGSALGDGGAALAEVTATPASAGGERDAPASETRTIGASGSAQQTLWSAVPRMDAGAGADDLAVRVQRFLARPQGDVTSHDLQRLTHATARELRPILRKLVDRGEVSKTGRARGTRYRWTGRG